MAARRVTIHPSPYMASVAMERDLNEQGVVLHHPHMAWGDFLGKIGRLTGRSPASGLALRLVLDASLRSLAGPKTQGFAQRLAPLALRLFRALDLSPFGTDIPALLAGDWWEGEKKRMLAPAWSEWRTRLDRQGKATEGDVLRAAMEIPALSPEDFGEVEEWRISGFRRLLPLHLDFIAHLADSLPARVVLELPLWTGRDDLYGPVLEIEGYLKRRAQTSRLEIEILDPPLARDARRTTLVGGLFTPGGGDPEHTDERVSIVRPANAEAQGSAMVARLREWLDDGAPLNDIALVVPDIEAMRPHLRQAIIENGLPLAYHRSLSVLQAPCFGWLHSLSDCLEHEDRLDLRLRLARFLNDFNLMDSPINETDLLAAGARLREAGMETLSRRDWRGVLRARAQDGEAPEAALDAIEAWLAPWRRSRTLGAWLEHLTALVDAMRIPTFTTADDARHFAFSWHAQQTVRGILGEWQTQDVFGATDPLTGRAFLAWLHATLDVSLKLRSSPEPESLPVLSPAEAILRPFSRLIALDLTQGRFPGGGPVMDLLRDSERARMNTRIGFTLLEGTRERYQQERMVFLDLLLYSEHVEFWAVSSTPSGEAAELSPFLLDLARLVPIRQAPASRGIATPSAWRSQALRALRRKDARLAEALPSAWRTRLENAAAICDIEAARADFLNTVEASARRETAHPHVGRLPGDWESRFSHSLPDAFGTGWFDTYAACPFRVFLERVLALRPFEEEGQDPDPLEIGLAVHHAVDELVREEAGGGTPDFDALKRRAEAKLHAWFSSTTQSAADRRLLDQVLHQWAVRIRLTLEGDYPAWRAHRPSHFERPFGREGDGWPGRVTIRDTEGLSFDLVGRMDRVDLGPGGAVVVDYKASRYVDMAVARLKRDFGLTSFQMPIYLMALAQAAEAGALGDSVTTLGARYLVVGDPLGRKKPIERFFNLEEPSVAHYFSRTLPDDAETPSLAATLRGMVKAMHAGCFDITPRPDACGFCPFGPVCRVNGTDVAFEKEKMPL